ncbi:MAG: hypothetical protein CVU16_10255 [Betaproteobacteria bacterium HGW-Betaproteobacteria-10]|nr:MAG: hypothetical protein CVU16_10255 [Betaproteobacteria bacterium HGW-Betaproteobacteria-10]
MMNSPLALFRDLFPFKPTRLARKLAGSSTSLLKNLSGQPPLEVATSLTARIIPLINEEPNLASRFERLEAACQVAEQFLPTLENLVMQADLPLPAEVANAAIHADNLLKSLAASYADVAREVRQQPLNAEFNNLHHQSILRAISTLARRQFLAYRAYATPSATSWQMLHELYRMACDPAAQALSEKTAPIEHEYLGALLLGYMEPGNLPRTELETIYTCTHQMAAYAAVGELSKGMLSKAIESRFLVRTNEGNPGYPLTRLPVKTPLTGDLIIDCSQVLAAIDRNLSRPSDKPVQPNFNAPISLLQNMRALIAGKATRRFSRTKFKPRADLINGLDAVISFINGNTFSRRSLDGICRHEARAFVSNECSLVDEGPDSFRVKFVKGEKANIGVGDLIALQPRESSQVHICLVKRIASGTNRLELGLQLLSPQVSVVDITAAHAPSTRGLFLHSLPAYGKISGLIVPPGKLTSGQKISFNTPGKILHRQIGKCIEANEGLEFVALDPLPD